MPDDVRNDFISYKVGDDRPIGWALLEVDGQALAAEQFRAYAQVRRGPGDPVLHEWSTENGRARFVDHGTDDAPSWWVELFVDDSRGWTWTEGLYDLFIVDVDHRAQPIAEGRWVNRAAITDWSDA